MLRGNTRLTLLADLIVAETVYVLESFYELAKPRVAEHGGVHPMPLLTVRSRGGET